MYERFWDLHLAAGSEFDFPNDIAEYARYQRQIKTNNKIAGPALMLVNQFNTWGRSAALLLSRFEGIEVWVEADLQNMLNYGLPDLMRGLDGLVADKSNSMRLTISGLPLNLVKRKIPVGVPETRFFPSEGASGVVAEYECKKDTGQGVFVLKKAGAEATGDVVVFGIPKISDPLLGKLLTSRLAASGYLAMTVDFDDVANAVPNKAIAGAVEWLVGKPSKLRINSHGDGEGNLEMGMQQENKRKMPTAKVVDWLVANGLKARDEWKTFSIFVCMAARYKDVPAGREEAVSSPATQSAVDAVAERLREKGITGVKVTGANEVTWGVTDLDGIETTGGLLPGQGVQMIAIPPGWAFDKDSRTLTVPNDWKIERLFHQGKQRIILSLAQGGAKVAANPGTGWDFEVQGKTRHVPQAGWTVDPAKAYLIATDGWRHGGGQTLRYAGSGGTVGIRTTSTKEVHIVERLAKSGAKFAAIS